MHNLDGRLLEAWDELAEKVTQMATVEGLESLEAIVRRLDHPQLTLAFEQQKTALGHDEVQAAAAPDAAIREFAASADTDKPEGSLSVLAHRASKKERS